MVATDIIYPSGKEHRMSNIEQAQVFGNSLLVKGLKLATAIMPMREPKLTVGPGASTRLADVIAGSGVRDVLIVTTPGIVKRGQIDGLINALKKQGVEAVIFDGVEPDPTFTVVNQGLAVLRGAGCDAVVAFGGGSAMDAAKVIAVAAANNCKAGATGRVISGGGASRCHCLPSLLQREPARKPRWPRSFRMISLMPRHSS